MLEENKLILVGALFVIILILLLAWWSPSPKGNCTSSFYALVVTVAIIVVAVNAGVLCLCLEELATFGSLKGLVFLVVCLIDILAVLWVFFVLSQNSIRSALTVGIMMFILMMWLMGTILSYTSPSTSGIVLPFLAVGILLLVYGEWKMFHVLEKYQ